MAEIAENREKSFENFLKLLPNIRAKIIDEMTPSDRIRFTRCSKLCDQEVKASKNYVYGLELACWPDVFYQIDVTHRENGRETGFVLDFRTVFGRKRMSYQDIERRTFVWEVELDNSTDLFEYTINEFRKRMKICQYSVKYMVINGLSSEHNAELFEIKSLNNLEELDIRGDFDFQQILSKLQKPLRKLIVDEGNGAFLTDYEQICQVTQELNWWNLDLNSQQFQQLSAKDIAISIGTLTEKDVFNFIRSWQNGTIGREIENLRIISGDSDIDYRKLLRLLRIRDYQFEKRIEIEHYKTPGKCAQFACADYFVTFEPDL